MKNILAGLRLIFLRILKGADVPEPVSEPDFRTSDRFVVGKPLSRGGPLLVKVNDGFRKNFLSPGVIYPNYSCRKLTHSGIRNTESDSGLCDRLKGSLQAMAITEPEFWRLLHKSRRREDTFFSNNANYAFMEDRNGKVWKISFVWDRVKQIGEGWIIGAHELNAHGFHGTTLVVFYPGDRIPAPEIEPS